MPDNIRAINLTYERWIIALKADADAQGKSTILSYIPESVLHEWWEEGVEPLCRAIAEAVISPDYEINRESPLESAS